MVNNPGRTRTGQPAQSGHSKRRVVRLQTNADSFDMNEVPATEISRQYIPQIAGNNEQSRKRTHHRNLHASTLDSTNAVFPPSYQRYDVPPGWYEKTRLNGTTELKQSLYGSPQGSVFDRLPAPRPLVSAGPRRAHRPTPRPVHAARPPSPDGSDDSFVTAEPSSEQVQPPATDFSSLGTDPHAGSLPLPSRCTTNIPGSFPVSPPPTVLSTPSLVDGLSSLQGSDEGKSQTAPGSSKVMLSGSSRRGVSNISWRRR